MQRKPTTRWAVLALGGLASVAMLFGLLVRLNAELGFAACTGTSRFGWIVPVLAGAVIGLVVLILLGDQREEPDFDSELRSTSCATCGSEVIDEWRLCPHCGELLSTDDSGRLAATPDART